MNAKEIWHLFKAKNNIEENHYSAWAFGGSPDLLAELVRTGEKTATASAYPLYEIAREPLPEIGSYHIILNAIDEAVCIIQTTNVYVIPFNKVSETHAFKEGEGDKSLAHWRKVHTDFFTACLGESNLLFTENMNVVCEEFKVVFKL